MKRNSSKKQKQSKIYNMLGRIQALFKVIHLNLAIIVSSLMTAVSAITTIVNAIMGENDKTLLLVTIASSSVTIILFVINVIKTISQQNKIVIHEYSCTELDKLYDECVKENGYELLKHEKSRLMYSLDENEYYKNNIFNLAFSFKNNKNYSIPNNIAKNSYRIFSDYLNSGKYFYDSKKIRLNSDIQDIKKNGVVQLSKTSYFNSICTNEISKKEFRYSHDSSYCFDGYLLVRTKKDGKGKRIYSLRESLCSNHIGVSTLAITSDGYVILTKQGRRNLVGTGKYVVSASGSLDYSDSKKCKSFGDIVVKGMERELSEECNIDPSLIVDTKIIGYGRLLDRGGKPEFFGLTIVNMDSDTFIKFAKIGKEKRKEYVQEFTKIPNSYNSIIQKIDEFSNNGEATIQLLYYKVLLSN